MVLFIDQNSVKKISQKEINTVVEKAFLAYGKKQVQMPPKSYLYFSHGDLRCMPGYIKCPGLDIAGIKSVNVHPLNRKQNLPTVMAVTILVSPQTGQTIAVVDASYLTALRTGAAGGVAAKYLSKKNSSIIGIIGAGVQSRTQLQATCAVRKLKHVKVYDLNRKSAEQFSRWAKKDCKVTVDIVDTPKDACQDVDILTTVTPSSKPIVKKAWITEGTHINAIGADAKGKQELFHDLVKASKIVIDDWAQASHSGEINTLVRKKKLSLKDIYAELGSIVAGKKKGRTNNKEITVFDSTGLSIQDISSAYYIYKKMKKAGKGREIKLS